MTNYKTITSPSNKDLELVLFVGKEGIQCKGVRVFEGIVKAGELVEQFTIEAGSHVIPEHQKRQRDLEASRAKSLNTYFASREDTVLPGLTIFVSGLSQEKEITVGNRKMSIVRISSDADRFICDGQNRIEMYRNNIEARPELADQTLNVKFIVSDTDTLESASELIRQTFCDYHRKLSKPTPSQNLYFDSSEPYSVLLKRFRELPVHGETLQSYVAVSGRIKKPHLMSYKQLEAFINVATASTASNTNALLKAEPEQGDVLFDMCAPIVTRFFTLLPLPSLPDLNKADMMFTKSIFWQGVAWLVRSMMEEAIDEGEMVDWDELGQLTSLPLADMTDDFWVKSKVVLKDEDNNGNPIFKMLKGSEKAMGRALCKHMRVYYCEQLG